MPPPRTDPEILDLAIRMGLVKSETAADVQSRIAAHEAVPDAAWDAIGLSADDRRHLSYVADRIHTIMESGDEAMKATLPPTSPSGPTSDPPRQVGRYRIERLIARGGMGRVWSAVDETLQRSVALKDVRPDVLQDEIQRRFLDEAKITARLEHPGIVPVYDMPTHDGGPAYVMRFVHGKTLARAIGDHHHRRRNGDFDSAELFQLVQSFRSICQTIAYAHAQDVIHRDLKPDNVLLGDFGEVLVLDWGLAKVTAHSTTAPRTDAAANETQDGQLMGTPAYMSPEQTHCDPRTLGPRSDVWSLGVVLYELLTGQKPFHAERLDEILVKIRNEPPAAPRSINPQVPSGLEAICLKALRKTPDERYAAAELADDVGRWLADEPVRACPEPLRQRAARWARRHKAIVASTAVLLVTAVVALSIGTFFIERQRVRADQQRERAEANLKTALEVVDSFFVTVSENRLLNEPGMQPLRAELLQSAVAFAERFARENAGDRARQLDLARIKLLHGRVLATLNDEPKANAALTEARDLFAKLGHDDPNAIAPQRGQALASLNLGVLKHQKDPALAAQSFREAIDQYDRLRKADPKLPEAREKQALALNNLARLKTSQGKLDDAEPLYVDAISLAEELTKSDPDNPQYADELAGFHANYAEIWLKRGNIPQTRKHVEASWAIRQQLAKRGVKDLNIEDSLADSQNHLGHLSLMENQFAQAEGHFRQALALRTALARRNPDVPKWKRSLARAHYSLSNSLGKQGRYPQAFAEADRCIELMKELAIESPNDPGALLDLGWAHLRKAYYLYDSNDLPAAEDEFTRAIDRLEAGRAKQPERGIDDAVDAYWTRAMVRGDRGRYQDAIADYDRAIQLDPGPKRAALTKGRDAAARKAKR